MAYEKIPLSSIKKIDVIVTPKGMTASQVMKTYKPDFLLNGALYDMSGKQNITNVKDEGKKSGYLFSDYGIGITGDKDIKWCKKTDEVRDFIAGSPTLVVNGKVSIDWGNKHSSYIDGSHKRSVLGFNGTHLFLLASDYNNTIKGLAGYCVNHGMTYAINLDGGGSCHLQKGSRVFKKSTRANVSWILVYLTK